MTPDPIVERRSGNDRRGALIGSRYDHEISDRALDLARRRTALRDTPQTVRSIPLRSVREATHRASCLPSLLVAAFILGIAFLEGAVPALVAALR